MTYSLISNLTTIETVRKNETMSITTTVQIQHIEAAIDYLTFAIGELQEASPNPKFSEESFLENGIKLLKSRKRQLQRQLRKDQADANH